MTQHSTLMKIYSQYCGLHNEVSNIWHLVRFKIEVNAAPSVWDITKPNFGLFSCHSNLEDGSINCYNYIYSNVFFGNADSLSLPAMTLQCERATKKQPSPFVSLAHYSAKHIMGLYFQAPNISKAQCKVKLKHAETHTQRYIVCTLSLGLANVDILKGLVKTITYKVREEHVLNYTH